MKSINEYYSPEEASKLLRLKKRTLYNYASKGLVPSIKTESSLWFLKKDIDAIKAEKDLIKQTYNEGDIVFFDGLKAEFINYVKGKYCKISTPTDRALIYFEGEGMKFVHVKSLIINKSLKEAI